jgi:hypothetical protein
LVGCGYLLFAYNIYSPIGINSLLMLRYIIYIYVYSFNAIIYISIDSTWQDVEFVLKIVQTAACLEIVHSVVGLVKSPWFTTFLQGLISLIIMLFSYS